MSRAKKEIGADGKKYSDKIELVSRDEADGNEIKKNYQKLSKFKKLIKSKKTVEFLDFLIPEVRLAFIKLRQAFVKSLIIYYFDLKYCIQIETDVSGYVISGVFSLPTFDDLR